MATSALLTSHSRVSALQSSLARRVLLIVAASLVVAATARVAFPLPFTPVPFTLQPLAVLSIGLLLGPVDGALALLAYLAEGAAGLPVFSPTGPGGLLQLFGPTGGYLLADPLVAFLAGYLANRFAPRTGSFVGALAACCVATTVLFAAGAAWLGHYHPASAHTLWLEAVLPFLPGEAVKAVLAASLFQTLSTRARA